jgi:hypothetical protein
MYMKNFSKKVFLSGMGIAFLLATTSVHAMEKEKDKPKTAPAKQAVVVQPNPQNAAAAAAPAPSAAPVPSASPATARDTQTLLVFKTLSNQDLDMGYIQPDIQKGAKLVYGDGKKCWDFTTTATKNVSEFDENRRQLVAYLAVGQGPDKVRYTTVRVTGEIEWISGTGAVYFGLLNTKTGLAKKLAPLVKIPNHGSSTVRAIVGLFPETLGQNFTPSTEIAEGRPTYKINWEIAPGADDVIFFTANLTDTIAQYKIKNLQVLGPTEVTVYSQFLRRATEEARAAGTLVDATNKATAAEVLANEDLVYQITLSTNPQILEHRIHKRKDTEKSGTEEKEKSNKDKEKEKKPGAAAPAPAAAAKPLVAAPKPATPAKQPTAATKQPATPPNGAAPGATVKPKPATPAAAVVAAGAAKK